MFRGAPFEMWSDDEILDALAGPVDAPALWRLQFFVSPTFNRWSVVMLEEQTSGASAYLWGLSRAQANDCMERDHPLSFNSNEFEEQQTHELPEKLAHHWQNWRFARVGEVREKVLSPGRDGTGMTLRSFDGSSSSRADLSNPVPKLQPLRWQASQEIFEMLTQLFGWNALKGAPLEVKGTHR